jgi:polysaccharide chain length determinant protein (PEP-CTERM system associated)
MEEILQTVRAALGAIWRRRWWALVTAVMVGIAGVVVVMRLPAVYEANARVYVDTQSILNPLMAGLAVQPNVDQQVSMMARTLLTRPNVERVARLSDLDLQARTPNEREAVLEGLTKNIRFSTAAGGINLYSIAYSNGDPQTARKVVQSLLSIFVESNLGDKRRDSEQARKFIDDQIKVYEQRLTESENAIKDFKIRNMALMPSLAQDYIARQTELQGRLTQARMDLREAENGRDELKKQLAGETPSFALAAAPSPGAGVQLQARSELDDRIEALRKRGDDLLIRFTDEHPEVVNNKRVLEQLELQRDAQRRADGTRRAAAAAAERASPQAPQASLNTNPVYQQLRITLADSETQVASLKARVSGLEGQLAQARLAAQSVPKVEAELTQLNREYEVNKRNYDQLLTRRESAKLAGDMEASTSMAEFRVIDPPRVGTQPVSPNRPMLLIGVLLGSIVGGLAVAFLRDQTVSAFHDAGALRKATGKPILGLVTQVEGVGARRKRLAGLALLATGGASYITAFLGLLAYLMLAARAT